MMMTRSTTTTRVRLPSAPQGRASLLIALLLLLTLAACSNGDAAADAYWRSLQVNGDEVEGYDGLREMTAAADIVARGEFTEAELGRVVTGDAPGDQVAYLALTFSLSEVLAGTSPADEVVVEFIVPRAGRSLDEAVADVTEAPPAGEYVVFLRFKAEPLPEPTYRLVNSLGMWTTIDGATLDTPLRADDEPPLTGDYADELQRMDDLDDMADAIRVW